MNALWSRREFLQAGGALGLGIQVRQGDLPAVDRQQEAEPQVPHRPGRGLQLARGP